MRLLALCRAGLRKLFVSKHRTSLAGVFLFILVLGLTGPANVIHAQAWTSYAESFSETIVLMLTTLIQGLTSAIAYLALSLIEMIVVPILQYNSFSTSETIGLGWSLVRDVVNMFVILVLLVIAIATIVGYEKVSWQKNLPQFLLAVVLVNFSRTICGFLIDISQVIMFTFVNALLDVAAGNFATFLSLDLYGRYSLGAYVNTDTGNAEPITAMMQLGAAYLQFIIYGVIAVVLLILALAYIWRIVLLWVLVILSPLTFFTWGLGGMFKFAAGMGGDWWKKFTAALTMGPMLTFFLWLSLAIGSGDIVAAENFRQPPTSSWMTLEMFETSNLLGTFLALVLLVVGMQQSAAAANTMGGLAKKYLGDEKFGKSLVAGALKLPLNYTDRQLGRLRGGDRVSEMALKSGLTVASNLNKNIIPDFAQGAVGRTIANVSGFALGGIERTQLAEKKAAKERVGQYTDEQLYEHVRMIAAGQQSPFSLNAADDIEAIKVKALTDGDFRKKLKKEVGVEQYQQLMKDAVNMKDGAIKAAGGDMDKVSKARSQNVHLMDEAERVKFVLESDKFNARDMSDEAASSTEVMELLKKKYIRTDNNGRDIFASDEILKGAYGEGLRKAASGAGLEPQIYDAKSTAEKLAKGDKNFEPLRRAGEPHGVDPLAASIHAGRIKLNNLKKDDFDTVHGDNLTKALLQSGITPDRLKDEGAQIEFLNKANALHVNGELDVTQIVQLDLANLANGASPIDVFGDPATQSYDVGRIERVLEKKPELVGRFIEIVGGTSPRPDVQDAISRSIKVEQVRRMTTDFKNSISATERAKLADNMNAIARALEGTLTRQPPKGKGKNNSFDVVSKSAVLMGVKPPRKNDRVSTNTNETNDDDEEEDTTPLT